MICELIVPAKFGNYGVKGINNYDGEPDACLGYCHYCKHWFVVRTHFIGSLECGGTMTTNCEWCANFVIDLKLHPEKYEWRDLDDDEHCYKCGRCFEMNDEWEYKRHSVDYGDGDVFLCVDCYECELEKQLVIQKIMEEIK